jgi:hypothetical protein
MDLLITFLVGVVFGAAFTVAFIIAYFRSDKGQRVLENSIRAGLEHHVTKFR